MFERFTDRARRSVVLAQEEARSFNHNYIGTEHLLLGLMREEEGIAAKTLAAAPLDIEAVRTELDTRVGRGVSAPKGHMPFTPRAKKVLELALREALRLGHNYIGTEHVLLGLLREGEGVAAQILMTKVEGGLERIETVVLEQLSASGVPVEPLGASLQRLGRKGRRELSRSVAVSVNVDEIVARLEAIEARLSAIERVLRREKDDEEDVS